MTHAIRACGAVPAITAMVHGMPTVGLEADELERFLARDGIEKVSTRDLAVAMARGLDGATTVAAAIALAAAAGIPVLATGGIGGVHRAAAGGEAGYDESNDLAELARTPIVVVCAGPKAILDLEATVERLETLGMPLIGFGTDELPAFYSGASGIPLAVRVDSAEEVAQIYRAQRALGRQQAVLVVQAPPAAQSVPRATIERAVEGALSRARDAGVAGSAVTPFLLAEVDRATGGQSRGANLALLEHNARLAALVANALTR